ncbi:MAG: hypothetical protein Q4B36_05415 [Tissierellia bacterium]|nr:hypothetical protein [Tissierellia bacterium]
MGRIIKYDLKSNFKFFASTLIVYVIFMISIASIRGIGAVNDVFKSEDTSKTLVIIEIIVFSFVVIYFLLNSFYKDLYTKRGVLTFTLPVNMSKYLFAKTIVIDLFYVLMIALISISLKLSMGININRRLVIMFLMTLFIINLLANIAFFCMEVDKFYLSQKNRNWVVVVALVTFILIFTLAFLLCYKNVFYYDGMIKRGDNFLLAFIYPFEGKCINIVPFIYYFIVNVVLFALNVKILNDDLDLS